MKKEHQSTESYKGVRDFYPKEMAVQRYIFDTWSKTAESFGYERYDASILEPAALYKAKGSESEEIVNEQTYTFTDRGDREVTLRPEMTPTVARMVAGKRRELNFPLRWYSIPSLYRYERPQRGRLREHWQLNCDLFGSDHISSDVELIVLAYQLFIDFGATPEMFEILINDRREMAELYNQIGITDNEKINQLSKLNDLKKKISKEQYRETLSFILNNDELIPKVTELVENTSGENQVTKALAALGIHNVKIDRSIARGFNYYTGTIFEIVDKHPDNNRSMLGGGRYDNLTAMFSDDAIPGIGFGMGDVTMRDFLETHDLLPESVTKTGAFVTVIPTDTEQNLESQKLAKLIREAGLSVTTDISNKKIGKKIAGAVSQGSSFVVIVGEEEVASQVFTLKNLVSETETKDTLENIIKLILK